MWQWVKFRHSKTWFLGLVPKDYKTVPGLVGSRFCGSHCQVKRPCSVDCRRVRSCFGLSSHDSVPFKLQLYRGIPIFTPISSQIPYIAENIPLSQSELYQIGSRSVVISTFFSKGLVVKIPPWNQCCPLGNNRGAGFIYHLYILILSYYIYQYGLGNEP